MTLNFHGIFGLFAMTVMVAIAHTRDWNIPWLFFVLALLLYSAFVLIWTQTDASELRVSWGAHLSFALLVGVFWLGFDSFWVNAALFVTSIVVGFATPWLLFKD